MTASTVFFLLLVLACPLIMVWMMRGGHSHGGQVHAGRGCGHHGHGDDTETKASTEDLRHRRDELDRLIEEREENEQERSPAGASR